MGLRIGSSSLRSWAIGPVCGKGSKNGHVLFNMNDSVLLCSWQAITVALFSIRKSWPFDAYLRLFLSVL